MARDVRDIVFRFVGESRDLQRATSQAERGIGGVGGAMKKVAGLAAGAFAVSSIVDFGKASIDAASDYQESVNAVQVATGEASEGILKLGDTAAEQFGISRTNLNEAAVALDGFLEQLDQPQDQAFEDIIGRATDFASVMNLDVNDALSKFRSGLAGESEPLRNFGIDLSAAAVSAHAVSEGLHATGRNMTEAEKIAARYSLIMQETSDFQNDFANTADSAANRTRILEARMADLQVEIGQELLPVYNDLLGVTLDLAPALSGVARGAASAIRPLGELTGGVSALTDAESTATERGEGLRDTIVGYGKSIGLAIPPIGFLTQAIDSARDSTEEMSQGFETSREKAGSATDSYGILMRAMYDTRDAAQSVADVDLDEAASRVERYTERTTAALNDVVGAWTRARNAANSYTSLDFVAFGVGDDRPSERGREDDGYAKRNGTRADSS